MGCVGMDASYRVLTSFDLLFIFLVLGTTYVECKTGYGLEWPGELRLLKLLEQARSHIPIGISITYCAAHAVPKYEEQNKKIL